VRAYLFDTSGVLYHDFLLVTIEQAHAELIVCKSDESYLIRGAGLELSHSWIVWIRVGWRHIMA
jgi:hypothetical protein